MTMAPIHAVRRSLPAVASTLLVQFRTVSQDAVRKRIVRVSVAKPYPFGKKRASTTALSTTFSSSRTLPGH
jgi:hypothetical protein